MAARSKVNNETIEIKDKQVLDNEVQDIEFKELQKKKFRLDRDNNRIIELNTSDLSIVSRLEEIYPKMLKLVDDAQGQVANEDEEGSISVQKLIEINDKMKELLDYGFDSKISDKACPSGTLYDPINGKFRFEYIMEKLIGLYDQNFTNEFDLMKKRIEKHTSKYTKKRK